MKILTNHVGYDPQAQKIAIIQTKEKIATQEIELRNENHEIVAHFSSSVSSEVAAWTQGHFQIVNFTEFTQPGTYRLVIKNNPSIQSWPIKIEEAVLGKSCLTDLLFYFKGQRCSGIYDRKDHAVNLVNHPEVADVHGGWYDASGDLSKYLSHLSYANFMNPQQTPLVAYNLAFARPFTLASKTTKINSLNRRIDEEAAHGADFLVRLLAPEGYFYMTVFDRWSKDITQREICSYSTQKGLKHETWQASYRQGGGLSIAALALIGAQNNSWGEFSPNTYLSSAAKAFIHLEEFGPSYCDDGKENIIDDYSALLAATELGLAALNLDDSRKISAGIKPSEFYLTAARKRAKNLIARISKNAEYEGWLRADEGSRPFFHASDAGLPIFALIRYLDLENDEKEKYQTQVAIRTLIGFELAITAEVSNPFNLARQYVISPGTQARSRFFIPHENESAYWWQGENARLASLASSLLLASKKGIIGTSKAKAGKVFAKEISLEALNNYGLQQISWILGFNPYDMCMLQGKGHNNPEYLENWPNAPGGVCNGITAGFSDENDIAFKPDSHKDDGFNNWRWGEQWIPHGAHLFLALALL